MPFLLPTKYALSDAKIAASKYGFTDVTVKQRSSGACGDVIWVASAKVDGLAMWHAAHGKTRLSALSGLVASMQRRAEEHGA